MKKQPVIAICGVKNSGKTTLVEKLVSALVQKGLRIATIKHDAHQFDPDVPGRDSYRHRAAGAYGTAVFDGEKYMVIRDGAQTIEGLLSSFPEADMILLEGARSLAYPKIEIVRRGNSEKPINAPGDLLALVTDLPLSYPETAVFDINDIEGIVAHMLDKFPI